MKKLFSLRRVVAGLIGTAVVAAVVFGSAAVFTQTQAKGPCICPMVYAPVICDNGKTYPNLCVANCKHAKGCEPIFIIPPVPY